MRRKYQVPCKRTYQDPLELLRHQPILTTIEYHPNASRCTYQHSEQYSAGRRKPKMSLKLNFEEQACCERQVDPASMVLYKASQLQVLDLLMGERLHKKQKMKIEITPTICECSTARLDL